MEPRGEGRSVPSAGDLERFGAFAGRLTGIDPGTCLHALRRAIRGALDASGAVGIDELYGVLAGGDAPAEALERFVSEVTVGETHFFRDAEQFLDLERIVLPEIASRRSGSRRVRIWSAGCSTGEEAYSLAMIAHRAFDPSDGWDVRVLGTDLDRAALRRARTGVYGPWSFREMPAAYREDYVRGGGRRHTVAREARSLVRFVAGDLREMPDNSVGPADLVLCRNVLMYMRPEAALEIRGTLAEALAPGGWLVLGRVEQVHDVGLGLRTERLRSGVAYRRPGRPSERWAPNTVRPAREIEAQPAAAAGRALGNETPVEVAGPIADARSAFVRAKRLAGQGKLDEAERWVEFALERNPLLSNAHFLKGLVRLERGDAAGARRAFRRCLFLAPDFVLAHLAMATTYARLGSAEGSMRSLRTVTRLLAGHSPDEEVSEGDGMSVRDVLDLVGQQAEAMAVQGGDR
jgi:chemotaxis protein methyltransferase CheR